MKYTLLDLVQTIGSSINSDEINSVSDTVESLQIATLVRTVYLDIVTRSDPPELYSLINLEPTDDINMPILMSVPDTVAELLWLKYDNATTTDTDVQLRPVVFLELQEFLTRMHNLDVSADNVDSFTYTRDANSFDFLYYNDKHPQYYTTFDDRVLVFDSFDDTVDTTLQRSKTLGYAKLSIPFTTTDTFDFPFLDEEQHPLLLNEAKALAWAEMRQAVNAKAEQSAKRQWTAFQSRQHATEHPSFFDRLPNYGRK